MNASSPRFIHPIHARGVRGTNFAVRGQKLLSDRRIHQYAKEGFYGTEIQAIALGKKPKLPRKRQTAVRSAMDLLRAVRAKLGLE